MKNRQRRAWYERQKYQHVKKVVLGTLFAGVLSVILLLFWDGINMPTVYKSQSTKSVIKVEDGKGHMVYDLEAKRRILSGRYEIVWIQ